MRFDPCIFLDVDGVLADFTTGICKAHGVNPAKLPDGEWDYVSALELTETAFYKPCRNKEFWEQLPLVPHSREFVRDLRALAPVVLCTKPTPHAEAWAGKYTWIRGWFGPGVPICMITPEKSALARPGAILIDDRDASIEAWEDAGGIGILYPQRWNAGCAWRQAVKPLELHVHEQVLKQTQRCLVWNDMNQPGFAEADGKPRDGWRRKRA